MNAETTPLDQANRLEPEAPPADCHYIHHRHLLLLSLEADTHFTVPRTAEGWVDLDGWPQYVCESYKKYSAMNFEMDFD